MPDKKNLTRTFASELRSLPVELVPPDPAGLQFARKPGQDEDQSRQKTVPEGNRGLVDRLIDRIKRI
jgi:hypothetical protein